MVVGGFRRVPYQGRKREEEERQAMRGQVWRQSVDLAITVAILSLLKKIGGGGHGSPGGVGIAGFGAGVDTPAGIQEYFWYPVNIASKIHTNFRDKY